MKLQSILKGLTVACAAAFASSAMADGLSRGSLKDSAPPPFSWTGFYIGANAGAIWGEDGGVTWAPNDATTQAVFAACIAAGTCPTSFGSDTKTGVAGGVQVGYNLQLSNIVLGVETDFQGSNLSVSHGADDRVSFPGLVDRYAYNTNLEWFGTVRARLGLAITPTLLAYVTGGLAYGEVSRTWGMNSTILGTGANGAAIAKNSSLETGWTVGGGFEWAMTSKVTIGAEYLYLALDGGNNFSVQQTTGPSICLNICNHNVRGSDLDAHLARMKVNFKL